MRLTKSDKEAFVRAVMDDVPEIDYEEEAQKVFDAYIITVLPPPLVPVFTSKTLRQCLDSKYSYDWPFPSWVHTGIDMPPFGQAPSEVRDAVNALAKARDEQRKARAELRGKLTAVIGECSTLKTAEKRLPEFTKYLPADRDGTGTGVTGLPVVANLVADLVTAGWPKSTTQGA